MKKALAILAMVMCTQLWANISISLSPSFPVQGESFSVIFNVETTTDQEPFLSFDPNGVEVIGRSRSVKSQITFSNGRTVAKKTYVLVYEMKAPTARTAFLRNITVDVGSKTLNHKDVSIKISKETKERGDTFVLAEVSNDNPYVGQGIDVRYYLYTRNNNLINVEIKEFPKLNGFIKRFHKIKEGEERVQYNGQVYRRYLKYSARLFPEKSGELKIDSLRLTLRYRDGRNRIGTFGSLFGGTKERTKSSQKLKIKVLDLPAENVPPTFTGLVGVHNAKLRMSRNKYLINEPIEVRLEITGEGALEKLEAPKLWSSELLEDFDTKSEYVDIDAYSGRKIFDYTYLVRGNGKIPSAERKIFYFNPETRAYVPMSFSLDELTLSGSGGVTDRSKKTDNDKQKDLDGPSASVEKSISTDVVAPFFSQLGILHYSLMPKWVLTFLTIIYIALLLLYFLIGRGLKKTVAVHDRLLKKIYKKGLNYKRLSDYIISMRMSEADTDIKSIVRDSKLKDTDKQYFLKLIKELEEDKFFDGRNEHKKIKLDKKPFESFRSLVL